MTRAHCVDVPYPAVLRYLSTSRVFMGPGPSRPPPDVLVLTSEVLILAMVATSDTNSTTNRREGYPCRYREHLMMFHNQSATGVQ